MYIREAATAAELLSNYEKDTILPRSIHADKYSKKGIIRHERFAENHLIF